MGSRFQELKRRNVIRVGATSLAPLLARTLFHPCPKPGISGHD